MSILEVKGLKKEFDNVKVLKGIDFSLEKGETLAMIGASGSGKTTLLRCLNFLETPTAGQILVNGNVVFNAADHKTLSDREIRDRRLHFGLVFQSFNLFPQYTALKNVTLAKELLAKERPDYKSNKKRILDEIQQEGAAVLETLRLNCSGQCQKTWISYRSPGFSNPTVQMGNFLSVSVISRPKTSTHRNRCSSIVMDSRFHFLLPRSRKEAATAHS